MEAPVIERKSRVSLPTLLLGLCFGFLLAAILYVFMAIGECLPRDGSAAMLACDQSKRIEGRLYPTSVLAGFAFATVLHLKRLRLALSIVLLSPLIALLFTATVTKFATGTSFFG